MAEEDRARSIPPAQAVFLAEVRKPAAHDGVTPGLAGGPPILEPIHAAIARTDPTVSQRGDGLAGTLS